MDQQRSDIAAYIQREQFAQLERSMDLMDHLQKTPEGPVVTFTFAKED